MQTTTQGVDLDAQKAIEGAPLADDVGHCLFCSAAIPEGALRCYDPVNGEEACEACAPTYGEMLAEPEHFLNGDEDYHTAETAKAVVDAHLAAGGSLEDKLVH